MKSAHVVLNLLLCGLLTALGGCVTGGVSTGLGIPTPTIDQPLRSAHYYEETYKVDLYKQPHSMSDELASSRQAQAECNKILSHLKIMGKSPTCPSHEELYTQSKRINNNDYLIALGGVPRMEIQKGDGACWAACVQFLARTVYDKNVEQDAIIAKIKGTTGTTYEEQAGSLLDAMRALGMTGLAVVPNGSYYLLESLAKGVPVMIGLRLANGQGHAVVVVAARYSFIDPTLPLVPGRFAFAEFLVYDPAKGEIVKKDATEMEREISFLVALR